MAPTRWGILGCGKISSDFVTGMQFLDSSEHVVVAVAARSAASAKKFADNFNVTRYYDNYQALATDPDIDVVYNGTINTVHHAETKKLLEAGKNVLCEKPLTMSIADTKDLIDTAKKNNVFLMEAMWSRTLPVFQELRKRLEQNELGEISHVSSSFGVRIADVARLKELDLGGGVVGDIGIYCLNLMLWIFNDEKPLEIKTMGSLNKNGVELEVTLLMKFSNNRFGTCVISGSQDLPNDAFISGSKGFIRVEAPFWASTAFTTTAGADFSHPLVESDRFFNFGNSQNLKHEAAHVRDCLQKGLKESPIVTHRMSMLFAELMHDIRQQLGVKSQ